jgi:hypothetical protein
LCNLIFSDNFEQKKITWELDCFDDIENSSKKLQLIFKNVNLFTFDYPESDFLFEMRSVYSADIQKNGKNYDLKALIDMPQRKNENGSSFEFTVGEMCIGFEDLEVIGGLSPEAMEFNRREED